MKQTFIKSAMLLLLILSMATTRAQEVALKTNLLGWASTSANAGIEIGMGKKTTFQLFGTLNPWKFSGDKKMRFWNVCQNTDGTPARSLEAISSEFMP